MFLYVVAVEDEGENMYNMHIIIYIIARFHWSSAVNWAAVYWNACACARGITWIDANRNSLIIIMLNLVTGAIITYLFDIGLSRLIAICTLFPVRFFCCFCFSMPQRSNLIITWQVCVSAVAHIRITLLPFATAHFFWQFLVAKNQQQLWIPNRWKIYRLLDKHKYHDDDRSKKRDIFYAALENVFVYGAGQLPIASHFCRRC